MLLHMHQGLVNPCDQDSENEIVQGGDGGEGSDGED